MTLQAGQIIDNKYRIIRVLGQGGMGAVYEGENTRIHRRVAIKVLHAAVATKADIVQRFEREAQAAGRIGSEHIVEVLDLGNLPSGERFMVMEFLDGEPLTDRIKNQGRLPALEAAMVLKQLLSGLGAAHEAGIIHRDLKPDNVFLIKPKAAQRGSSNALDTSLFFVKLVDFGVSKFSALDNDSFSMTRTGAVMGTPYYMSPEQARGQKVDHRSDLYSVGVVAYQMITGRVPFNADTFNELLFKIALESPEPAELHAPGLDPNFAQIVAKGMARDPNHRFQHAGEFIQAIDQWLNHARATGQGTTVPQFQAGAVMGGGRMATPLGTSGFMAGQQAGPLGQSGVGMPHAGGSFPGQHPQHALGQSGSGPHPHPGGALGQSGSNPAFPMPGGQPSNPAMNQSQVALAITAREPKRNGALIAIAITAVVGIGGGIGIYKYMGAQKAPAPTSQPASEKPANKPTSEPAKTAAETSAPAKTAEAVPTTTAEPTASESAAPAETAAPTETAEAKPPPVAVGQKPPPVNRPPPTKPPPPSPPPPPPPGGRKIGGSL